MVSTYPTGVQNNGSKYILSDNSQKESVSPNQSLLPLSAKVNKNDNLEIGGCDVITLVKQFGSPLYILDEESLRTACRQYRDSFKQYYKGESQVLYASKAWNCLAVCAIVASEDLGIDVASGGELYTAIQSGANAAYIYLHSNNKSRDELQFAVESGCTVVVDNWYELNTLVAIASEDSLDRNAPYRIMLRLTPGIDCHTHDYIRTGDS